MTGRPKAPDWADRLAAKQIRFINVKNYLRPVNGQHGERLIGPDKCFLDINEEEHRELKALRTWFAKHLRAAYRKGLSGREEKALCLICHERFPSLCCSGTSLILGWCKECCPGKKTGHR